MKRLLAYGFTLLYLIALCRPVAPLIEYYLRQDYFATVLCVNQEKPEMSCHGQCALAKKLGEVNEPVSDRLPLKIDFTEYPIGFVAAFTYPLVKPQFPTVSQPALKELSAYCLHLQRLFKPPRA